MMVPCEAVRRMAEEIHLVCLPEQHFAHRGVHTTVGCPHLASDEAGQSNLLTIGIFIELAQVQQRVQRGREIQLK